jgi:hypothetical protein
MSRQHLRVYIEGVALWHRRLPNWETARAVIRGEAAAPDAAVSRPAPTLLAPTERRRAPDTVAVALEVASRARAAADRSPKDLPSVFASTHGDLAISDYMCTTLATTPNLISPIKFHNSVHNAASGYWSIGTGSLATYTAISAAAYTFGTGLLETAVQALAERTPALYVAFDIEAKGALATVAPSRGVLGAAFVIAAEPSSRSRALDLEVALGEAHAPSEARSAAFDLVRDNALAPCFPFIEALAASESQTITLGLSEHSTLRAVLAAE